MHKQAGISVTQRRALRQHAQQHSYSRQHQLKAWYEAEFQRSISQPTVSDSLSRKFSYLDCKSTYIQPSQRREKPLKWPESDKALAKWQQERVVDRPISGELIKRQAVRFWNRLDCYQGMEVPQFSNGWLEGFKKRHNIKSRLRPGEDGSVSQTAIAEQLVHVQALARLYPLQDVYNCDETGLFWKMTPERGLSTQQYSGTKQSKVRIMAHFCCNADGSDKLPIWFIGKSANPRCFGSAGIKVGASNYEYGRAMVRHG